ncbi:Tol-Pal system beta propeller repeat protein TolB [Lichenihabitans sp. Uapishka_5]|uniref:Tol-Pal system beta propeller repeat protein TolB n=1 Tax=Lichenihabitans sp. Uapishka_5 TaxID=3037302 RepID=UPI0029E7FFA5|nr:Tol-Pal system beta propeller repeat protein TolB [Lichenihabitans sp. Uapishka_5]MDX7953954.1 Tol-Pal system beta propeller repeat protein TolB [Lichenihabitans sp. Uapishka_5]
MQPLLSRRATLAAFSATAGAALMGRSAVAQDRFLDIRPGGAFRPVTVAVTNFGGDADQGAKLSGIIANDFKRCTFIQPVDASSFPEPVTDPDAPNLAAWKATTAQFVLTGRTSRSGGSLNTAFRLWDLSSGSQVAGQQYATDAANSRRVAHIVADAVFTRVTGEKGFFDSRVVFVDETGSAEKRKKRLAIMDQDGFNVKYLTRGEDLVVTPRFSPSGQEVAYMSFGQDEPKVFLLNFESGQRSSVGDFPGMTFAPRFSPNGQDVIMSLSQGANSDLYSLDIGSKAQHQLTNTAAIDTSPCYSPDGGQIVFESDRGGTQQIYVMPASGGGAKRISFGEGRYSTPVWSPKGDLIAFTRQKSSGFAIGVMKPDGSGERILTEGFHNEGPTWAPNGLYVMFFRDPGGSAGSKIYMVDVFGRGEFLVPTPSFASDPNWGPLQG